MYENIHKLFTKEDIRFAFFEMDPWKSPGPDGIQAAFYQKLWKTVGDSLFDFAASFFLSGKLSDNVNDTLIVLIHKIPVPKRVSQLRPIGLCNVNYKVITKAMANKLKSIMPEIINPNQSICVPGHQIFDNVILYHEALHSMRKKTGLLGHMAIKIDLEKAYDRL